MVWVVRGSTYKRMKEDAAKYKAESERSQQVEAALRAEVEDLARQLAVLQASTRELCVPVQASGLSAANPTQQHYHAQAQFPGATADPTAAPIPSSWARVQAMLRCMASTLSHASHSAPGAALVEAHQTLPCVLQPPTQRALHGTAAVLQEQGQAAQESPCHSREVPDEPFGTGALHSSDEGVGPAELALDAGTSRDQQASVSMHKRIAAAVAAPYGRPLGAKTPQLVEELVRAVPSREQDGQYA